MSKVFISYSWESEEHKEWVMGLRNRLEEESVHTILDRINMNLGDSIPKFMEESIRNSKFVLLILTPTYKEKADARIGGVGYEEAIITGEVLNGQTKKRFIPVLAKGDWGTSTPYWALGRNGVDLSGEPYREAEFQRLLDALKQNQDSEVSYSLSGKQVCILNKLANTDSLTPDQLEEQTGYTNASINYQIKGLIKQGIVEKRDASYALTELGQRWLSAA